MGAFIGYGDIGVWATNGERDAFLDWFAAYRCAEGDTRWEYCKSEAQRWAGYPLPRRGKIEYRRRSPRVALRPPVGGLRSTRGYTPSPRRGKMLFAQQL